MQNSFTWPRRVSYLLCKENVCHSRKSLLLFLYVKRNTVLVEMFYWTHHVLYLFYEGKQSQFRKPLLLIWYVNRKIPLWKIFILICVWCLTNWRLSTNVVLVKVLAIIIICYLQGRFYLIRVLCVTCWSLSKDVLYNPLCFMHPFIPKGWHLCIRSSWLAETLFMLDF